MATFKPLSQRNAHVKNATFGLVSDEATFELDTPPPLPTPRTLRQDDDLAQEVHESLGADALEDNFLGGAVHYVTSSNVSWIQYLFKHPNGADANELYIGYKDGSVYAYSDVSFEEALDMYRTGSKGSWVWDHLRTRGDAWGWQKAYRLVSGNRVWKQAGADSQARHEAIPPSGAGVKNYHPAHSFAHVKGAMGATGGGINLGKRGGSKKIAWFSDARAKTFHNPKPK